MRRITSQFLIFEAKRAFENLTNFYFFDCTQLIVCRENTIQNKVNDNQIKNDGEI